ncbi:MAG: zinc-dependent alcohol dehydrogenase family protein [Thermosynechococcaceae cyanobacterium]
MKAIQFEQPGEPNTLQFCNWPTPTLNQDRDILVQLRAAGVNPIDTKLRQRGTFYPEQMPAILGCDGAGVVQAIGSAVQGFQVGDEVYFCNGGLGATPGTYCEYAVLDERFAAHKPKSLSFAAAAAAPLVLITAWEALFDRGRLESGQTVLIQSGTGGVGHVAIQLAKLKGATVLTTVSSAQKATVAKTWGADATILYPNTDVVEATMTYTNGVGVDLSFDTVGGSVLSQCFSATRFYGDVVTLLGADSGTDWSTARTRNLRVSYELMLTPLLKGLTEAQIHQVDILRQCAKWFDAGQLHIDLTKTFPLEAAADAHQYLEAGSMQGKIALLIG